MVDQCAHQSYVSEDIVQKLGLKKEKTDVTIEGLNGIQGKVKWKVNLKLKLCNNRIINTYQQSFKNKQDSENAEKIMKL